MFLFFLNVFGFSELSESTLFDKLVKLFFVENPFVVLAISAGAFGVFDIFICGQTASQFPLDPLDLVVLELVPC